MRSDGCTGMMLDDRPGGSARRRWLRRAVAVGAAAPVALLTGCIAGPPTGPDVSQEGQVAYGCALVDRVGDEDAAPEDWDSIVGDDADPGSVATLAAAALLGGLQGGSLDEHPELTAAAADAIRAVSLADLDGLGDAVLAMQAGCDGVRAGGDASPEGQVAYACALAASVRAEHGAVEQWGSVLESPAWRAAGAAAALVGALNGGAVPGTEDLAQGASDMQAAPAALDEERMQTGIDAFVQGCAAR